MTLKRRQFIRQGAAATALGLSLNPVNAAAKAKLASSELSQLDAIELAARVRNKDISAAEVVEDTIKRIEAINPTINAVVIETFDLARKMAGANNKGGVFSGVPYVYKNLSPYKGVPHTAGSRAFKNRIPSTASELQLSVDNSGAVLMGMSSSPEFGLVGTTEPMLYGPCHNPWDLERSPAGSSGGSGAAVAAGLVPIATASDGGGSIRMPASQCGLVGLKYSRYRELDSLKTGYLSSKGCLSRSVRDTAAFLALTERKDFKGGTVGYIGEASKKRLRIAFSTSNIFGKQPAAEVDLATRNTAKLLAGLGHHVEEKHFEINGEEMMFHFLSLWASSPVAKKAEAEKLLGRAIDQRDFEPLSFYLIDLFNNKRPADSVKKALAYFSVIAQKSQEFFTHYDVYLTPVLTQAPVKLGEHGPGLAPDKLLERTVDYVSYTPVANAVGVPSLSLPLHWTKDNLPVGSMFTADYGQEATLLALAYELELAKPWKDKWAPTSAAQIL